MALVRPDATCKRCGNPIGTEEEWMMASAEDVFHKDCLHCTRCSAKIRDSPHVENGHFFCQDCLGVARRLGRAETVSQTSETPSSPGVQCTGCGREMETEGILTAPPGAPPTWWCLDCSRCAACRSSIPPGGACFQLLDQLFCPLCQDTYTTKKYLLQSMGSGPAILNY